MRAAAKEVSINGLVDTKRTPRVGKRRNWPEAFKRQVVAETLEPGSSVSIVARRHDLNTNQLFKWRREMLPKAPPAEAESNPMVPVEIVAEPASAEADHRGDGAGCDRGSSRDRQAALPARSLSPGGVRAFFGEAGA